MCQNIIFVIALFLLLFPCAIFVWWYCVSYIMKFLLNKVGCYLLFLDKEAFFDTDSKEVYHGLPNSLIDEPYLTVVIFVCFLLSIACAFHSSKHVMHCYFPLSLSARFHSSLHKSFINED